MFFSVDNNIRKASSTSPATITGGNHWKFKKIFCLINTNQQNIRINSVTFHISRSLSFADSFSNSFFHQMVVFLNTMVKSNHNDPPPAGGKSKLRLYCAFIDFSNTYELNHSSLESKKSFVQNPDRTS